MKTWLVLTVMLLALSAWGWEEPLGQQQWYPCDTQEDCVLMSGSACMPPTAINRRYVGQFNTWLEGSGLQKCGPAGFNGTVSTAHCVKNRCTVIEETP
jgi:hypothetical protein